MKLRRSILIAFIFISCAAGVSAQSGKVPPFRMTMADGRIFLAQYLPIGKPIVIIYFSPDCEECQMLTSSLLSRISEFRSVSFAMITYQPRENIVDYVRKSSLDKHENIFAGTEYPTLFVRNYYNIMHFPYVILYNKNGDLIKKYTNKEVNLDDLLAEINKVSGK